VDRKITCEGAGMTGGAADGGEDRLAAVLRPVRAGNGFEEALEQILQIVRLGLVPAGERLPAERELAERLGISRVTLREVLRVLAEEGLVVSRRGRYGGTFVARPPQGEARPGAALADAAEAVDVAGTLRFREVLEAGAAELCAAQGLSEAEADRLRAALDATRDAPPAEYRRLDTLLHLTLVELTGSPAMTAQYAAVRATVNELLGRIPLLVRNLEHSQRQHAELVGAVLAGDAEGARALAREHCAGTAALLRGFLA
jgi:DNA-binding FadR family transcriptional regulator